MVTKLVGGDYTIVVTKRNTRETMALVVEAI